MQEQIDKRDRLTQAISEYITVIQLLVTRSPDIELPDRPEAQSIRHLLQASQDLTNSERDDAMTASLLLVAASNAINLYSMSREQYLAWASAVYDKLKKQERRLRRSSQTDC